jgi:hypothetical protein
MPLPPPPLRPASSEEPRSYLQDPAFSSCTIPIIFPPRSDHNFHHTFYGAARRLATCAPPGVLAAPCFAPNVAVLLLGGSQQGRQQARLLDAEQQLWVFTAVIPTVPHADIGGAPPPPADDASGLYPALLATPWRQHVKLVAHTGDGLSVYPILSSVVQQLSNLSFQSLADAGARLPEGWTEPPLVRRGALLRRRGGLRQSGRGGCTVFRPCLCAAEYSWQQIVAAGWLGSGPVAAAKAKASRV